MYGTYPEPWDCGTKSRWWAFILMADSGLPALGDVEKQMGWMAPSRSI
jgi:hypothetical protein